MGDVRLGGKGGGRGELSCGLEVCGNHRSLTDDDTFPRIGKTVGIVLNWITRVPFLNNNQNGRKNMINYARFMKRKHMSIFCIYIYWN